MGCASSTPTEEEKPKPVVQAVQAAPEAKQVGSDKGSDVGAEEVASADGGDAGDEEEVAENGEVKKKKRKKKIKRSRTKSGSAVGKATMTEERTAALVIKADRGLEFIVQLGIDKQRCKLRGVHEPEDPGHAERTWGEFSRIINSKTIMLELDEATSTDDLAVVDAWVEKESVALLILRRGFAIVNDDETRPLYFQAMEDAQKNRRGVWAPEHVEEDKAEAVEDPTKKKVIENTLVVRVFRDFTFFVKIATTEQTCRLADVHPPDDEADVEKCWKELSRMMNSKTFNLHRVNIEDGNVWVCHAFNDKISVSQKLCKAGFAIPNSEDPKDPLVVAYEDAKKGERGMFYVQRDDVKEAEVDDPDQLKVFENVLVTRVMRGLAFNIKIAINDQECRLTKLTEPDDEPKAELARMELGRMINSKTVNVHRVGIDDTGVWKCEVYSQNIHINKALVTKGWAHPTDEETRPAILQAYEDAKKRKTGMFAPEKVEKEEKVEEEDATVPKEINNVLVTRVERSPFEFWFKMGITDHCCKFRGIKPFDDEHWAEEMWRETGRTINSKTVNMTRYNINSDGDFIVDVYTGEGSKRQWVQQGLLRKGLCQLDETENRTPLVDAAEEAKKKKRGFYQPVEEEEEEEKDDGKPEPRHTDCLVIGVDGPVRFRCKIATKNQKCKLRGVREITTTNPIFESVDPENIDEQNENCKNELGRLVNSKTIHLETANAKRKLWKVDCIVGDKKTNVAAELLKLGYCVLAKDEKSSALVQAEERARKGKKGIWQYVSGGLERTRTASMGALTPRGSQANLNQ